MCLDIPLNALHDRGDPGRRAQPGRSARSRRVNYGIRPLGRGRSVACVGEWIGLAPTMVVAAVGGSLSVFFLLWSPVFSTAHHRGARRGPRGGRRLTRSAHSDMQYIACPSPRRAPGVPRRPAARRRLPRGVRDAIVDGTLGPGSSCATRSSRSWLGVSRTPVREALLRLAAGRARRSRPGRSTTVASLDTRAARDAQAVVAAMHELAVPRGRRPAPTADDLDADARGQRAFRAASTAGDADAALAADDELHGIPVRRRATPRVAAVLDQFTPVAAAGGAAAVRLALGPRVGGPARPPHRPLRGGRPAAAAAVVPRDLADPRTPARRLTTRTVRPRRTHVDPRLRALPAHLRPEPGAPARAAHRAPRRRPGLGQARGLQQRPGLWRQQDPQARVHRPGRARPGRRHPRLDRRLPVATTPARSPRSPPTSGSSAASCRRSGSTGTTRSTTRSATSCCRGSWAPTPGSTRTASTSASARSWEDALREVEESGRHALRHPGRRVRTPARRARVRQLGLRGGRAGEGSSGVFFDTIVVCTVTGSTHAGMIAGFAALEDAGGRPRRVIGIDASATLDKTRDQVRRIAQHTAELIGLGRTCATTRSPCSRAGRATSTASPSSRRSRRSG